MSLCLPHLAIELRPPSDDGPAAVTEGTGPRRRLLACNATALERGLFPGASIPSSMMREPALRLIERSKADETRAMRALACWSHQFTSDVCLEPARWTLWLELGASLRYFNGLSRIHTHIRAGMTQLGYTASIGIAPTLEGAALLGQHPDVPPALNLVVLRKSLAPLPLTGLHIGAKAIEQLQVTGLRTIADLLAVPFDSLARRFGEELPAYLQRLVGERAEVRRRHRSPPVYRRRFEFPQPVSCVEGLLFPLRRALQEFEGYLRGRDRAIQALTVQLAHRGADRTDLGLTTSAPQRDSARLFALLREKLERMQLRAAVTAIALFADTFVEPRITQQDFFDTQQQRNENWVGLVDKLRARLAAAAVRQLGLRDDHRPEHAWCIAADQPTSRLSGDLPDRPLWLLEPKQPLEALPALLGTPERIEAGWWTGEDSSRDYYLARTEQGAQWWLFRDARTNQWYLQGLWA